MLDSDVITQSCYPIRRDLSRPSDWARITNRRSDGSCQQRVRRVDACPLLANAATMRRPRSDERLALHESARQTWPLSLNACSHPNRFRRPMATCFRDLATRWTPIGRKGLACFGTFDGRRRVAKLSNGASAPHTSHLTPHTSLRFIHRLLFFSRTILIPSLGF